LSSGGYFHKRLPAHMHKQAVDKSEIERLWIESEKIITRSLN